MVRRLVLAGALAVLASSAFAPPSAAAEPRPFGRTCEPHAGVRHCAATSLDGRVPTFDGTPIDVDVTLPATGDGPFPTVVLMHGLSSSKREMQTADPHGGNGLTDVYYAKHGYAAVVPNQRGHGGSCGTLESRDGDRCARGWLHLADQRYEVRDMQHLLGVLVDEGIADPRQLGAAGCSYGSAITLQLAMLRDRVRLLDGGYAPWRSPDGTPLEIKAGYATCAVADWVALLAPNGRLLDHTFPTVRQSSEPAGTVKASVGGGALALLGTRGYVAPPLVDETADFQTWVATALTNPPDSPLLVPVIEELATYHGALGIDISRQAPAPLLVQNGWADDLTPPEIGGLRLYRYLRGRDPDADITLQFADWGHTRSRQKRADAIAIHTQGRRFLDAHVRGIGTAPPRGSVTAYTQSCPRSAPSAGPFTAPSWHALHPGEVRFGDDGPRTITELSADPVTDLQHDPVLATPCATVTGGTAPGVAVYRHRAERGFTVLGLPTIDLDVATTGRYGRLTARLWDEAPGGARTLVTRGVYRLTAGQTGHVVWQLFGGGWRFEPGHTARLEIAGGDAPFFKPADAPFSARISNVRISLPTAEPPDGGEIRPNAHVPPERCLTTISVRTRRPVARVVVRSGGRTRVLRRVRRGTLRLEVAGRRATVKVVYRSGTTRIVRRDLCSWV